jgi:PAS domain-containing protein
MSQHLSSEQLMLSPEQLSSLLGSTRELLALLDSDGSVLYANEGFGRVLG